MKTMFSFYLNTKKIFKNHNKLIFYGNSKLGAHVWRKNGIFICSFLAVTFKIADLSKAFDRVFVYLGLSVVIFSQRFVLLFVIFVLDA